jgi:hypothetical protein
VARKGSWARLGPKVHDSDPRWPLWVYDASIEVLTCVAVASLAEAQEVAASWGVPGTRLVCPRSVLAAMAEDAA